MDVKHSTKFNENILHDVLHKQSTKPYNFYKRN